MVAKKRGKAKSPAKVAVVRAIRETVQARGVTEEELGQGIGVGRNSVNRILNNRAWVSFETLLAIAGFLKVPITDLFKYVKPGEVEEIIVPKGEDFYGVNADKREELAKGKGVTIGRFDEWYAGLLPVERLVVNMRLLVNEPPTLEQLASLLGVSKERVRQIQAAAINKL